MKPTVVSIRTVAERAGVSIATVSNVLNNRTNVGPDLARRVRMAVDELGYVADGVASRLRSRRQSLAGVIVPDLKNPLFGAFVSTLEALAQQDGVDLLVASCRENAEQEAIRLAAVRSWRPSGCIVVPVDGALAARRPRGGDMPLVAVDRIPDDPVFDLVAVDNHDASAVMTAHLAQQGFARCVVAGSDLAITNIRERWNGAEAGAGASMAVEWLPLTLDIGAIRTGLSRRLFVTPRPDVIFCLDNITTLVAYETLKAMGLIIGRDIGLASFDEMEWMRLVTPGISAIAQPVEEMARAAWSRLTRRVSGDSSPPDTIRLACRVTLRGSSQWTDAMAGAGGRR